MLEESEREILAGHSDGGGTATCRHLIGSVAPIVSRLCKNLGLLKTYPQLRSAAVLALSKLMAVDLRFCESHLQLLFTLVQKEEVEVGVRSNTMIALGDLAIRFPNQTGLWTEHLYHRLGDSSVPVRKNAVMVLSHLILNDMTKVKGLLGLMARRIEDPEERIQNLVKLFFTELAKRGGSPIYNHLPDMLSRLSAMEDLPRESLENILRFLLEFIDKVKGNGGTRRGAPVSRQRSSFPSGGAGGGAQVKQSEGLIDKLCHRFKGTEGKNRENFFLIICP